MSKADEKTPFLINGPEVISFLLLALMVGLVVWSWPYLPERVPYHYNLSGHPDAWGGRGSLIALPAAAAFLYLLLSAIGFLIRRTRLNSATNDARRLAELNAARSILRWVKIEITAVFLYIEWGTIQVALGKAEGLSPYFLPVFVVIIFGTSLFLVVQSVRHKV